MKQTHTDGDVSDEGLAKGTPEVIRLLVQFVQWRVHQLHAQPAIALQHTRISNYNLIQSHVLFLHNFQPEYHQRSVSLILNIYKYVCLLFQVIVRCDLTSLNSAPKNRMMFSQGWAFITVSNSTRSLFCSFLFVVSERIFCKDKSDYLSSCCLSWYLAMCITQLFNPIQCCSFSRVSILLIQRFSIHCHQAIDSAVYCLDNCDQDCRLQLSKWWISY